ncbi:hypothetical protein [Streptomyces sp. NPDC003697]
MSNGARTDSVAQVADAIGGLLETVYAAVERTRRSVHTLLAGVPVPTPRTHAAGAPRRVGRVGGRRVGFVAEPDVLADVPAWLEW